MLRAHRTTVAPSLANSFAAPAPIPVPESMCYYRCYCRDKGDVCEGFGGLFVWCDCDRRKVIPAPVMTATLFFKDISLLIVVEDKM